MPCVGVCTICKHNRDSRLCTCLGRRRNADPFHEGFNEAVEFIEETRFFGNDARDDAYALIGSVRQQFYADVASGKLKDGDILKRIDRDATRLRERADGRLYATRQKLSENPPPKRKEDDGMSNAERLRARLAKP